MQKRPVPSRAPTVDWTSSRSTSTGSTHRLDDGARLLVPGRSGAADRGVRPLGGPVRALGLIAASEPRPVLLAALHDTAEAERLRAAGALGAHPTWEAAGRLASWSWPTAATTSHGPRSALGGTGPIAAPTLNGLAHHLAGRSAWPDRPSRTLPSAPARPRPRPSPIAGAGVRSAPCPAARRRPEILPPPCRAPGPRSRRQRTGRRRRRDATDRHRAGQAMAGPVFGHGSAMGGT